MCVERSPHLKNLSMKHFLLLMLVAASLLQGQKVIAAPPPTLIIDTIPRLIQAARYNTDTGVVVVPSTDAGGGNELDSIRTGDRVDYFLWVPFADTYTASFRVATAGAGATFLLVNDSTGVVLDTVVLPATGGLSSWQTVSVQLTLPYGYMALRVLGKSATPFALNWIDIEMPTPPPASQAAAVPGIVQAENYIGMLGVGTQPTADIGHGLNVGWIDYSDWMNYYVNIPSPGTYTLSFRVATPNDHAQFLLSDLTDKVQMLLVGVPNTGGLQNWTTITATYQFFSAGPKVLQLRSTFWDIWNINWIYLQQGYPTGGSYGGQISASNYVYESGVQLQWTSDTVNYENVYNVGWIDIYDWMNYYVYLPQGGPLTASFRVATPYDNASFEVLSNSGNVLATVHVPNTGGFQNWKTVQVPINLPAGVDTVWIMSTSWNIWNFHWLEFDPVMTTSAVAPVAASTAGKMADSAFAANTFLWPNPVTDVFTVQMNDELSGKMVVQVIDGSGVLRLETTGDKAPGSSQVTIPVGTLPSGVYFVRIIVGDQLQVRKVLKL